MTPPSILMLERATLTTVPAPRTGFDGPFVVRAFSGGTGRANARSWLNWGKEDIGSTPGYMGPHEKLLLGWLDYTVADKSGNYTLGAANKASTKGEQAVNVTVVE